VDLPGADNPARKVQLSLSTGRGSLRWNKGKLLGQKPPLKLKETWATRIRLQLDRRSREPALFNLAIDSRLRGCDLVALRVRDVGQGSQVARRAAFVRDLTLVIDMSVAVDILSRAQHLGVHIKAGKALQRLAS